VTVGDGIDDPLCMEAGAVTPGGVVALGLGSLLGPPSVRPPVARRYVGRWHDARCRPRCGVVLGILLITEISGPARAHDY
jgi:hypothetical protein